MNPSDVHASSLMPADMLARLEALQQRGQQPTDAAASTTADAHPSTMMKRLQQLQGRHLDAPQLADTALLPHDPELRSNSHHGTSSSCDQAAPSLSMSQRLSVLLDRDGPGETQLLHAPAAAATAAAAAAAAAATITAAEQPFSGQHASVMKPHANHQEPELPSVWMRLQELQTRKSAGATAEVHSEQHPSASHAGPHLNLPGHHISGEPSSEAPCTAQRHDEGAMAEYLQRLQLLLQRPEPGDDPLGMGDAMSAERSPAPDDLPMDPHGVTSATANRSGVANGGPSPMPLGSGPGEGDALGAPACEGHHTGKPPGTTGSGSGSGSGSADNGLSARLLELAARSLAAGQWAECSEQLQSAQQLGADGMAIARLSAMASVLEHSAEDNWQAVLQLSGPLMARDAQRSYRRLAALVHPDKAPGAMGMAAVADAAFKALGQAYQTARQQLQAADGPSADSTHASMDGEDADAAWWQDWEEDVQQDGVPSSSSRPSTQPSEDDRDPVLWSMSLQELQAEVALRQRAVLQPQRPEDTSLTVAERQKRLRAARSALSDRIKSDTHAANLADTLDAEAREFGGGFIHGTNIAQVKRQRMNEMSYK